MPHLTGMEITKAWRHSDEVDRIHYVVTINGRPRHLYVDKDTKGGLYRVLADYLEVLGYTGPKTKNKEHVK